MNYSKPEITSLASASSVIQGGTSKMPKFGRQWLRFPDTTCIRGGRVDDKPGCSRRRVSRLLNSGVNAVFEIRLNFRFANMLTWKGG